MCETVAALQQSRVPAALKESLERLGFPAKSVPKETVGWMGLAVRTALWGSLVPLGFLASQASQALLGRTVSPQRLVCLAQTASPEMRVPMVSLARRAQMAISARRVLQARQVSQVGQEGQAAKACLGNQGLTGRQASQGLQAWTARKARMVSEAYQEAAGHQASQEIVVRTVQTARLARLGALGSLGPMVRQARQEKKACLATKGSRALQGLWAQAAKTAIQERMAATARQGPWA